jgi:phosphohistidine phosphatase
VRRRRLLLIRHAKAGPARSDADRPLTDEGVRSAEATGAWLAREGPSPDHALVSAARRAVETWDAVCRGAGWELEPELSQALYTAEPDTALDLVREAGDASTLSLVGHNPTMGSLAQLLDDGDGEPESGTELATTGFPAGAVAVFEHDGAWSDLTWAGARLLAYHSG